MSVVNHCLAISYGWGKLVNVSFPFHCFNSASPCLYLLLWLLASRSAQSGTLCQHSNSCDTECVLKVFCRDSRKITKTQLTMHCCLCAHVLASALSAAAADHAADRHGPCHPSTARAAKVQCHKHPQHTHKDRGCLKELYQTKHIRGRADHYISSSVCVVLAP